MKSFLLKITKLSILCYVLLWLLQFIVDHGLKSSQDELYYDWNKIYKGRINTDIIFLGSSRTLKHYNPNIFEDKLSMTSYNLGANGAPFDIQTIKRKAYLKNNTKPKLIVLNVDIGSLLKAEELYKKEQYLPYYSFDNFKDLKALDENITLEYMLPMYKYRDNFDLLTLSVLAYFDTKKTEVKTNKGFHGSNQSWNGEFEKRKKDLKGNKFDYSHVDYNNRVTFFKNTVEELDSSETEVLLVWAPEYIERQDLEGEMFIKSKKMFKEVSEKYKRLKFIDFTNDTICKSKIYFYDSYHLNKKGASIFSTQLADSISKYYKNK
jgi:hypothetical protein